MKIRFLHAATTDARDARRFYSKEAPGLGDRFNVELRAALQRIRRYPQAWPVVGESLRKLPLNGFPYLVFYILEQESTSAVGALIIAVHHTSRSPVEWQTRLAKGT